MLANFGEKRKSGSTAKPISRYFYACCMSFTVYKSSAGSGKTFTLVKEYLSLALADAEQPPRGWRHILAVTFTNKAASEMKNRILETLDQLSQGKTDSVMAQLLQTATGLGGNELQQRAARLLQTILHNYGDFAVGTIDSFVHRIVRTFAYDLDLPVNFEIEMDVDKMLREAVNALIERIGSNPQLTEFLVRFAESKAEDDRHWQIESDLQQQARYLLSDDGSNPAEQLRHLDLSRFAAFRDTLEKEVAAFEAAVQHDAKQALDSIRQSGADASSFANGERGIVSWFKKLAEGDLVKTGVAGPKIREAFELNKRYASKATASQKDAIDRIWPRLEEVWNSLETIYSNQFGHYVLYQLLLRNIYAIAVLNEIERELIIYKTDNNVLHISEFNRRIADIVLHEPVPFIYERLGEKYQHYLIDEFQDTSSLQWQNLLPLLDNALSENRFTMLVGDGKQAIYRWRGGEVEQFARLPHVAGEDSNELIAERAESLKRNYREMQLMQNFRSKAEIIQFNNLFFRSLSERLTETHQPIYLKLEQEYDVKNTGGLVRIEVINTERKMEKEEHALRTVAYVEDLLREGFKYNEIAVLTRTNREGALAANALIGAGIPVLSSESLLLKNAASVNFLTAMLRLIETSDDIARATIIRFLVDTQKIPGPIHERITELKKPTEEGGGMRNLLLRYGFEFNTYMLAKFPLYQRCQELLRLFGMADAPDPYLLYFLDEVLEYASARNHLPADFLNWWEDRREKASVSVPEGTDAVRVMTIHKSKGLEFPAVVLPFCNWNLRRGKDQLWIPLEDELLPDLHTALVSTNSSLLHTAYADYYADEQSRALLDNLNLVYVAQTRAVERLYILTGPGNSSGTMNVMNDLYHHFFKETGFTFATGPVYESGNPELHTPKNETSKSTIVPEEFGNFNWTEHISIRAGSGSSWAEHEKQNDRQVLLKTLLRRLRYATDSPKIVEQAVQDGLIISDERTLVGNQLQELLRLPQLAAFYDANNTIRTGDEIALPNDTGLKPERVVVFDDHTELLSFETAEDEAQHQEIKTILERIYNRPCVVQVFDPVF